MARKGEEDGARNIARSEWRGWGMIICGIGEHDLRAALDVANYAYSGNLRFGQEPEPIPPDRLSWRVGLGVEDPDGPGCRREAPPSWWHPSWWGRRERRSYSACYHAHRDFLYAIFEREPSARVTTSLAVYDGLANFEASYRRAGMINVGSYYEPVPFAECCDCSKFPRIAAMMPEPDLGEYAIEPERRIYSGLRTGRRR